MLPSLTHLELLTLWSFLFSSCGILSLSETLYQPKFMLMSTVVFSKNFMLLIKVQAIRHTAHSANIDENRNYTSLYVLETGRLCFHCLVTLMQKY